jgi:hypothetical protein
MNPLSPSKPLASADGSLVSIVSLAFLFWLWANFALALCNAFFAPLVWLVAVISVAGIAWQLHRTKLISKLSRELLWVASATFIFSWLIATTATPTILSGRDQGSYSAAALHLATNHQLSFATPASQTFFALHQSGKALNFPGFDYTITGNLISQFPLGYIVWLASWCALFGVSGLLFANALTLFLFLTAFFVLLRLFVDRVPALWGLSITATSLIAVWLSKITLSENLAVVLFVLLAFHLTIALKDKNFLSALIALLVASFFAFTRIEGFFFLIITIIALFLQKFHHTKLFQKNPLAYCVLPTLLFLLFFVRNLSLNLPFYKVIGKAGLQKWHSIFEQCSGNDCIVSATPSLWHIFALYGLFPVFFFGFLSLFLFWKRRIWLAFVPALLAIPSFFYFFQPSISADHPWMLRRFLFSIYPSLLFSAILGVSLVQQFLARKYSKHPFFARHFYFSFIALTLFLCQLPFALRSIAFSENTLLLAQTKSIATIFSPNDLVLIDRLASGNPWAMLPEVLTVYGIPNAVYFFNPEDLLTLKREAFEHTYLIIPQDTLKSYTQSIPSHLSLIPFKSVTLNSEQFQPSTLPTLPEKIRNETTVVILEIVTKAEK